MSRLFILEAIDRLRKGTFSFDELDISGDNHGNTARHLHELSPVLPKTGISRINLNVSALNADALRQSQLLDRLPNTEVTRLDLESNHLGDDGAALLAEKLPASNVKELHLMWNDIGNKGAKALASLVASGPLEWLDLTNNKTITKAGVEALINALPSDRSFDLCLMRIDGAQKCMNQFLSKYAGHTIVTFDHSELGMDADESARLAVALLPNNQTARLYLGTFSLYPNLMANINAKIDAARKGAPESSVPTSHVTPLSTDKTTTATHLTGFKANIAVFEAQDWLTPDQDKQTPLHKIVRSGQAVYTEFFDPKSWKGHEKQAQGLIAELKKPENRALLSDLFQEAWQARTLLGNLDKATRQNEVG